MTESTFTMNPKLDLVLERIVDAPKELVWMAWTRPEQVKRWFTPAPWTTADCEIDLRPGGAFRTVMRSPEGVEYPHTACYLEVLEHRRLVWTTVLGPGFRPASPGVGGSDTLAFTAVISLESHGGGTKYTALVMHRDEAERNKHGEMGFHSGWGAALDQLVDMIRTAKA
jgi:uncharacterized protein YndB with AHSA1/START domain